MNTCTTLKMHRQTWIGLILIDSIYCFRCTCLSSCFPVSWVPSALIGDSKYGFALKWGAFIAYRQLQRLVRKDTILKVYMVYPHFRTKGQTHIPTMYNIPLTPKPRRIKLCRLWQLGMSTGDAINPTNTVKSQWFIMFIIMFDIKKCDKLVINPTFRTNPKWDWLKSWSLGAHRWTGHWLADW